MRSRCPAPALAAGAGRPSHCQPDCLTIALADRVVSLSPRPTVVQETLEVPLPRPRDQVTTKELRVAALEPMTLPAGCRGWMEFGRRG